MYDAAGRDHDKSLRQVMQIFQQEKLELNKNICAPEYHFWRNNLQKQNTTRPQKLCILTELQPLTNKGEL